MSVRWQHFIDHADTKQKPANVTRLSSRRSSAADRQSVKRDYCATGSFRLLVAGRSHFRTPVVKDGHGAYRQSHTSLFSQNHKEERRPCPQSASGYNVHQAHNWVILQVKSSWHSIILENTCARFHSGNSSPNPSRANQIPLPHS